MDGSARALRGAARSWFVVAVLGQWWFLYYIAAFYGVSTLQGDLAAWRRNTMLFRGYVQGDTAGNLSFAAHVLLAGVIAFGGALQLVPWIRARAAAFHRWNGRVFLLTAWAVSVSGLYMVWVRGASGSLVGALSTSLNGVLIMTFAALAWRAAWRRDLTTHRRWALRVFLVANAQWFLRVGVCAWILMNGRPRGMRKTHDGWFNYFIDFACFLVPLGVLELYLRVKDRGRPSARWAVASLLAVATLIIAVGVFGFAMFLSRSVLARS